MRSWFGLRSHQRSCAKYRISAYRTIIIGQECAQEKREREKVYVSEREREWEEKLWCSKGYDRFKVTARHLVTLASQKNFKQLTNCKKGADVEKNSANQSLVCSFEAVDNYIRTKKQRFLVRFLVSVRVGGRDGVVVGEWWKVRSRNRRVRERARTRVRKRERLTLERRERERESSAQENSVFPDSSPAMVLTRPRRSTTMATRATMSPLRRPPRKVKQSLQLL